MAYKALQLITRSLSLSQIVSPQLQVPDALQISDGLYLLNELLDQKSSDLRLIPYFSNTSFNFVAGQEMYFVPNLIFADSVNFYIGNVRYPLLDQSRKDYFASARVDNINSLPFSYRPERTLGGMNLYFYFWPASNYTCNVYGKFSLADVVLTTDLSLSFDGFYLAYLRYALAKKFCEEWGVTFPDAAMAEFQRIEKKLLEVSPADLKVQKKSYFGHGWGLDWQTINLTEGYWPF